MVTHTPHPDSHGHGLADGCPRCDEHAERPFDSLDDDNLRALVLRVRDDLPGRSNNEMLAMRRVRDALLVARRLELLAKEV